MASSLRADTNRLECVCGKFFDSYKGLESHAGKQRCQAISGGATRLPSAEATREKRLREAEDMKDGMQRFRTEAESASRRSRVALRLARMRYIKMIPGTSVDDFKLLHREENDIAYSTVVKELTDLLATRLPPEVLSSAFETIRDAYDIYANLLTEAQENAALRQMNLPILTYHPRALKGVKSKAYDFALDEQVTTLLDHCPAARAQMYQTITAWATKRPDGSKERRIVCDITDGSVFLNHPILGEKCRVTAEEAKACSETLPLNIALLIYWDGFTVRRLCVPPAYPLPCICVASFATAPACDLRSTVLARYARNNTRVPLLTPPRPPRCAAKRACYMRA